MPSLQPLSEGAASLAPLAEGSEALAPLAEGAEALAALAEQLWAQRIAGGAFTVLPTGSPTYPDTTTFPDTSLFPLGFDTGCFPSAATFCSPQSVTTDPAPRLAAASEGSLTLTPLVEA